MQTIEEIKTERLAELRKIEAEMFRVTTEGAETIAACIKRHDFNACMSALATLTIELNRLNIQRALIVSQPIHKKEFKPRGIYLSAIVGERAREIIIPSKATPLVFTELDGPMHPVYAEH